MLYLRIFRISLVLVFSLFFAQFIYGQKSMVLSLEDCIHRALKLNPDIDQSEQQLKIDTDLLWQQHLNQLPFLSLSGDYYQRNGKSINPFTNQFESVPIGSQNLSLTGSFTIYNGLQSYNQIKKQKSIRDIHQVLLGSTSEEVIVKVINAYLEIMLLKGQARLTKNSIETITEREPVIRKLVEVGDLLEYNHKEIVLAKKREESTLLIQQISLQEKERELKYLIQLDDETTILFIPINTGKTLMKNSNEQSVNIDSLIKTQSSVKQIELERDSKKHDLHIAKGRLAPRVSFDFGLRTYYSSVAPDFIPVAGKPNEFERNTFRSQLNNNLNSYAGITVSFGLNNFFQYQLQRNIVETEYLILEDQLKTAQFNEETNAYAILEQLRIAEQESELLKEETLLANEIEKVMEKQWLSGDLLYIDYKKYRDDLRQKESNTLLKEYEYFTKKLIWNIYNTHQFPSLQSW